MPRILPISSISEALWASGHLRLTSQLAKAFLDRLASEGLIDVAKNLAAANGAPGGESKEEADLHFATRFVNSAGRNLCAALDPHDMLGDLSDALIEPTLSPHVVIVDIPCGAGAAGLALLDCVRTLRREMTFPRIRLQVDIIAGDISSRAVEHYQNLLAALDQELRTDGIFATFHGLAWDVTDGTSNAHLVDRVVSTCDADAHVLVVTSNFSDAMTDGELLSHFEHFLSQLMGRTTSWPQTFCWIEPATNRAEKFLPKVVAYVSSFWRGKSNVASPLVCKYQMRDPLSDVVFPTGLRVVRCKFKGIGDVA